MGNVFCFNGFNRFTWFNMGRIPKNDRFLIKTIKTGSRLVKFFVLAQHCKCRISVKETKQQCCI